MSKKIHVRPGKLQSKFGFVVGIIFCLVGVFLVIPLFGFFGIFWTGIAIWITVVNYVNGFTEKKIDSRVIEIEDDNNISAQERVEIRLQKLQSLYNQSLISEEEYEEKKKEILDDL